MDLIYKSRVLLIRIAKVFPFVICLSVLISYTEDIYALLCENYIQLDDNYILYKPLSWSIAKLFIYDWYTIVVATILSCAFETCWYNKACIVYICLNAWERDYFITIELYPEYIYAICIANILICVFFCYKGIRILIRK